MFFLIGLYIVAGRIVLDAWVRARTDYGLTNNRILIARGAPFTRLIALQINQLPPASLKRVRNGRGTIAFKGPPSIWRHENSSAWPPSLEPTPQFIAIEDAESVFEKIQTLTTARFAV